MGNLQIKDMPAELHAELKRRASEAGMSQRDFVLQLLRREFLRPSRAAFIRMLQALPPAPPGPSGAELVQMSREERDAELEEHWRRDADEEPE
ncbi:MAG: hypothetical protein ACRD29_18985 [Acidimicrobiales bacterium]